MLARRRHCAGELGTHAALAARCDSPSPGTCIPGSGELTCQGRSSTCRGRAVREAPGQCGAQLGCPNSQTSRRHFRAFFSLFRGRQGPGKMRGGHVPRSSACHVAPHAKCWRARGTALRQRLRVQSRPHAAAAPPRDGHPGIRARGSLGNGSDIQPRKFHPTVSDRLWELLPHQRTGARSGRLRAFASPPPPAGPPALASERPGPV